MSRLTSWWNGLAPLRVRDPDAQAALDEWALWERARTGHAPSATELVTRLGRQALGLAMQFAGSREDAEDAVQESFIRLWRSEPRTDRGSRLSTYFNTIVINRCRTRVTARSDIPTDDGTLAAMLDDATRHEPDNAAAVAGFDVADTAPRLRAAMAALPVRQRMAIAMWTYADASAEDIARTMDIDANAAHQLLYRAKRSLRTLLEGHPT